MGAEVASVVLLRDEPGGEGGVICVGVEEASSGLAAGLHGSSSKRKPLSVYTFASFSFLRNRLFIAPFSGSRVYVVRVRLSKLRVVGGAGHRGGVPVVPVARMVAVQAVERGPPLCLSNA